VIQTQRLHYDDSLRLTFDAEVVGHGAVGDRPSVVLDQSAFYPESGGQLADHGTLDEARVVDVQVDDVGRVHHVLEGPLPSLGSQVVGVVDETRRRIHMAQHTGQHMLSGALAQADAPTRSSRLGKRRCTIDLDTADVTDRAIARAESLVNGLIDADLPVRAWYPDPSQLATLPLRRAIKVNSAVRIVAIGDFDHTPCGGTHCTSTAQVGLLRVTATEAYKGGLRLTFAAGPRARTRLFQEAALIQDLARHFTCNPEAVQAAVDKLTRQLKDSKATLKANESLITDALATRLLTDPADPLIAALPDAAPPVLRSLAARITHTGRVAALMGAAGHVVLARPDTSTLDCGAALKRLAAALKGRGGGRPHHAEGKLPPDTEFTAQAAAVLAAD